MRHEKHPLVGFQDIALDVRPGIETTVWLPNREVERQRIEHVREQLKNIWRHRGE